MSGTDRLIPSHRNFFVTATDAGAVFAAMSRAISSAAGSTCACGNARLARPIAAASVPLIVLPDSNSSAARDSPTTRVSVTCDASSGNTPRRTNANAIFAFSATMRTSASIGYVMPTPTAWPFNAAITGLLI